MPSLHSHHNSNVSKIGVLVLVFFFALILVSWRAFVAVAEIGEHASVMTQQIEDLMNDTHF